MPTFCILYAVCRCVIEIMLRARLFLLYSSLIRPPCSPHSQFSCSFIILNELSNGSEGRMTGNHLHVVPRVFDAFVPTKRIYK